MRGAKGDGVDDIQGLVGSRWLVFLVIVSGIGGYAVGSRQWYRWATDMFQLEAKGTLVQKIEELSFLKMGDVDSAVRQLESEADLLTVAVARNPGQNKEVLSYVKTYLSLVPPSEERARVLSSYLEGLPTLKPNQCKTALNALMKSRSRP